MLNYVTDYKCVKMTDVDYDLSGFISGSILPARTGGSVLDLKYEDVLFLQEAYAERANWRALPSPKITPLQRTLAAINGFTDIGTPSNPAQEYADFCDDDFNLGGGIETITSTASWWQTHTGTPVVASLTSQSIYPHTMLDIDEMRRAFYNVQRMQKTATALTNADIVSAYTRHEANLYDGYNVDQGSITYQVDASTGSFALYSKGGSRVQTWRKMTSVTYARHPLTFGPYPFVTGAVLLVLLHSSGTNGSAYEIVPVTCTVYDGFQGTTPGLVEVPDFLTDSFLQSALVRRGSTLVDPPTWTQGNNGSVSIYGFAMVLAHSFPADISPLNWGWTPS